MIADSISLSKCTIRGRYRNEPLNVVLDGMQLLVGFEYELKDKVLRIKGGSCQ